MRSLRSHLTYANVMSTLAALFALSGGVAYAANTVFSTDIVDGEVKTADLATAAVQNGQIANNQVFSVDVRDDTLANGGLTAADLAANAVGSTEVANNSLTGDDIGSDAVTASEIGSNAVQGSEIGSNAVAGDEIAANAVGTSELQGAKIFDSRDTFQIDDPVDGVVASEVTLLAPPDSDYEVIARCLENPAGTVKANIVVKSVGATTRTTAVDSNAPNGVNNVTNLAHGAEATLISVGPTTFTTWQTGQYAVTAFETVAGASIAGFNGNVAAATKFGNGDCRFQATALGGGFTPE